MSDYVNEKCFLAKVGGTGDEIVTGDGSANVDGFHKIYLPPGVKCENAVIQLQSQGGISNYNFDSDCACFIWAPPANTSGPGILYDSRGHILGFKAGVGGHIGNLKAPEGYKVSISVYN